ncbi:UNVERIFIED_CONTAM: hypothetical protein K2H54_034071 [Gekko kuhli]
MFFAWQETSNLQMLIKHPTLIINSKRGRGREIPVPPQPPMQQFSSSGLHEELCAQQSTVQIQPGFSFNLTTFPSIIPHHCCYVQAGPVAPSLAFLVARGDLNFLFHHWKIPVTTVALMQSSLENPHYYNCTLDQMTLKPART